MTRTRTGKCSHWTLYGKGDERYYRYCENKATHRLKSGQYCLRHARQALDEYLII